MGEAKITITPYYRLNILPFKIMHLKLNKNWSLLEIRSRVTTSRLEFLHSVVFYCQSKGNFTSYFCVMGCNGFTNCNHPNISWLKHHSRLKPLVCELVVREVANKIYQIEDENMAIQPVPDQPLYIYYVTPSINKTDWTINAPGNDNKHCEEYYCIDFDGSQSCILYFILHPDAVNEGWSNLMASNAKATDSNVTVAGPIPSALSDIQKIIPNYPVADPEDPTYALVFTFTNNVGSQLGSQVELEKLLLTATFKGNNYTSDDPRLGTTPPPN